MKTDNSTARRPVVMVIGGHDPSGGAGIQADIETVMAAGCHAVTALTAVTVQDSATVVDFMSLAPEMVLAQARTVMDDFPVAAIKTGMLANSSTIQALGEWLVDYPDIPLVIDPVLAANQGDALSEDDLVPAYREYLLPKATVATPNTLELAQLAQRAATLEAAASEIITLGCEYVLVTGGHEDTRAVSNRLYSEDGPINELSWPRLPNEYHGSGCTLASAIAAQLARGEESQQAVTIAQTFTYQALSAGEPLGKGQWIPNRRG